MVGSVWRVLYYLSDSICQSRTKKVLKKACSLRFSHYKSHTADRSSEFEFGGEPDKSFILRQASQAFSLGLRPTILGETETYLRIKSLYLFSFSLFLLDDQTALVAQYWMSLRGGCGGERKLSQFSCNPTATFIGSPFII